MPKICYPFYGHVHNSVSFIPIWKNMSGINARSLALRPLCGFLDLIVAQWASLVLVCAVASQLLYLLIILASDGRLRGNCYHLYASLGLYYPQGQRYRES